MADVTGQVFVVTPSGENMRLGSVRVQLFEEAAIEGHLRNAENAVEAERERLRARVAELEAEGEARKKAGAEADAVYRERETEIRAAVVSARKAVEERAEVINRQVAANEDFIAHVEVMPPPPPGIPSREVFKEYEERRAKWLSMSRADRQIWADAMVSLNEELRAELAQLEAKRAKQVDAWADELRELDLKIEAERRAAAEAEAGIAEVTGRIANLPVDEYFLRDLPEPLRDLRTDADGEFAAVLPAEKRYAIFARADRRIGGEEASFRWFVWVEPGHLDGRKIILSNHNLIDSPSEENVVQFLDQPAENGVNNS